MTYKTRLAVLLLSTTLVASPGLAGIACAYDENESNGPAYKCEFEHLSQDKLDLLHSTMKKMREDNKTVMEDLRKLREEREDILDAKTFNKTAYLSVVSKIEQKRALLAKSRNQAFASIADKFSPAERERVSYMIKHHRHGGMNGADWMKGEGREGWHRGEGRDRLHHGEEQKDGVKDQSGEPLPPPEQ